MTTSNTHICSILWIQDGLELVLLKSGRIKEYLFSWDFSTINLFYFDRVCWTALATKYITKPIEAYEKM